MKEFFIRRQLDDTCRAVIESLDENESFSLEISRYCFDEESVREFLALFEKGRCSLLTIASSRELRKFFDAFDRCGGNVSPTDIATIKLENPTQEGMESLATQLCRDTIRTSQLIIYTSVTPAIAASLISIAEVNTLEKLDLSHSYCDRRAINSLIQAFTTATNLKILDLSHCLLEDSIMAHVLTTLQGHPSLRHLDVSFNNCHSEACLAIGKLLKTTHLSSLKMTQQFIGRERFFDVRPIAESLALNQSLQTLDLKENFVSSEHLDNLFTILTKNRTLKSLDISCTDITDESLVRLAEKLHSTQIESLNLLHNTFRNAEPLVVAAKKNHRLKCILVDPSVRSRGSLWYQTALNRAGRHLLAQDFIPISLWPLLLEFASNIQVPEDLDFQVHDIMYYLLKGPVLLSSN